jgi:hydroxycarboxylate dehydrogenase B
MTFGEHKGYGMAVASELLGGALTGGGTCHEIPVLKRAVFNGMLTVLIDPARLGTQAAFEQDALAFVDWLQAGPVARNGDGVHIAGDPERAARIKRAANGIVLDAQTWTEIIDAGQKVGVKVG